MTHDENEVRTTDATTGGQKGTKLARFSLIPHDFLWALAEHYGKGAIKYTRYGACSCAKIARSLETLKHWVGCNALKAEREGDRNWEKGYRWSLSVDALERHLALWLNGEDNDPETGSSHLVAVAWHVIALWWWHKRGLGTDDVREGRQS